MAARIIIVALITIFTVGIVEFLIAIYMVIRSKDSPARREAREIDDIGQIEYLRVHTEKQQEKEKRKRVRKLRKKFRRNRIREKFHGIAGHHKKKQSAGRAPEADQERGLLSDKDQDSTEEEISERIRPKNQPGSLQ